MTFEDVAILIAIIFISLAAGWYLNSIIGKKSYIAARKKADQIIQDADAEIENLKKEKLLEINEDLYQQRNKLEEEYREKQKSLKNYENELRYLPGMYAVP